MQLLWRRLCHRIYPGAIYLDLNIFTIPCEFFDYRYWYEFDQLMKEEWNIQSVSVCENGLIIENAAKTSEWYESTGLLQWFNDTNVVIVGDERIDATYYGASESVGIGGVATPAINRGYVWYNGEEQTSKNLPHEILHLVLEERGYSEDIYVRRVHQNAMSFLVSTVRTPTRSSAIRSKNLVIMQKFNVQPYEPA